MDVCPLQNMGDEHVSMIHKNAADANHAPEGNARRVFSGITNQGQPL